MDAMIAAVPHEFMQISFLGQEVRPVELFQQAFRQSAADVSFSPAAPVISIRFRRIFSSMSALT